jgi:hypothetical protein
MHIDLTALAMLGVQLMLPVVVAIGGVAVTYLAKRLKLGNEAQLRDALQLAATNGAAYAMSQVQALGAAGKLSVDVKNRIIGLGAQYVLDHVPEATQKLGADQAAIERLVEAKLAQLVLGTPAPAAAAQQPSPVLPPKAA